MPSCYLESSLSFVFFLLSSFLFSLAIEDKIRIEDNKVSTPMFRQQQQQQQQRWEDDREENRSEEEEEEEKKKNLSEESTTDGSNLSSSTKSRFYSSRTITCLNGNHNNWLYAWKKIRRNDKNSTDFEWRFVSIISTSSMNGSIGIRVRILHKVFVCAVLSD